MVIPLDQPEKAMVENQAILFDADLEAADRFSEIGEMVFVDCRALNCK